MELTEKRLPDAPGWWARHRGDRVDWFLVLEVDGVEGGLAIWVNDLEDLVPVAKFSFPLTRWGGPVSTPRGWEK
jgi:hypothetical protein